MIEKQQTNFQSLINALGNSPNVKILILSITFYESLKLLADKNLLKKVDPTSLYEKLSAEKTQMPCVSTN